MNQILKLILAAAFSFTFSANATSDKDESLENIKSQASDKITEANHETHQNEIERLLGEFKAQITRFKEFYENQEQESNEISDEEKEKISKKMLKAQSAEELSEEEKFILARSIVHVGVKVAEEVKESVKLMKILKELIVTFATTGVTAVEFEEFAKKLYNLMEEGMGAPPQHDVYTHETSHYYEKLMQEFTKPGDYRNSGIAPGSAETILYELCLIHIDNGISEEFKKTTILKSPFDCHMMGSISKLSSDSAQISTKDKDYLTEEGFLKFLETYKTDEEIQSALATYTDFRDGLVENFYTAKGIREK